MSSYLNNITPDSLSGILFALGGIPHSIVLLNGPTGCKFYHAAVSDSQLIQPVNFDTRHYGTEWFFGQSHVPCTYLDNGDYVYGSREKLVRALTFIRDNLLFDILFVVNSPGAALIGDDLKGIAESVIHDRPVVTMQTPGFSEGICSGHEHAAIELLKSIEASGGFCEGNHPKQDFPHQDNPHGHHSADLTNCDHGIPQPESSGKTVNVLGLNLFQKNMIGDRQEITRLLELCGIRINCFYPGGGSLEEIRRIPSADLNLVIRPEYGVRTAEWLQDTFGTPYDICPGPPVGFSATEEWLRRVSDKLGTDPAAALEYSARGRARAYAFTAQVNSITGMPHGVTFSVEGTWSEVGACADFLTRYFGMVPVSVNISDPECTIFQEESREIFQKLGMEAALERNFEETAADIVLASGNTIARLKALGKHFSGIETALPTLGYYDVIPKTFLGVRGALELTEMILNGLPFS